MNTTHSPFIDSEIAVQHEQESTTVPPVALAENADSPFLTVFETPGQEDMLNPQQEAFVALTDEFFDEELEEALEDLAYEASTLMEDFGGGSFSAANPNQGYLVQQLMTEHYSPLLNEVERMLDHALDIGQKYDKGQLSEQAVTEGIHSYQPIQQFEVPVFEHFFGKIWGAAKKVAKKGLAVAKKLGLGPILKKLKRYVMSFLKGFLQKAMTKVPFYLRPFVQKLRDKYLANKALTTNKELTPPLQQELNIVLADMFLANTPQEMEMAHEAFNDEHDLPLPDHTEQLLQDARERLVQQFENLQEGESPEPAVEEFVTAVLTGLKWGIRIIGRKRVKNFLISHLSKITRKITGRKYAKPLSKLIVDQGFKMLNLETAMDGSETRIGHQAVANTLEDTLLQVAQLPDHILNNETLLEGYLLEAFEESATVNLPDMLSESTYEQHPRLRESNKRKLFWLRHHSKRGKRHPFKKLNRELEAELSPYVMQEIKTHDGVSLAAFLSDSMGVNTRNNVPVRVHMYELLPGGTLFDIARKEMGNRSGYTGHILSRQLHPLTSVAAGLLLGEPKLGCRGKGKCLSGKKTGHRGHRYYYLEIPQATPQLYTRQGGSLALRRPSQTRLKVHFIQREIEVTLFFSEADAQTITVLLRKGLLGQAQHTAVSMAKAGLSIAFKYPGNGLLSIVHPMIMPGPDSGAAFQNIPPVVQQSLLEQLGEWIGLKMADYLGNNKEDFIAATVNDADGLTMRFKMVSPAGLDILYGFVGGRQAGISRHLFGQMVPEIRVSLQTDYRYE